MSVFSFQSVSYRYPLFAVFLYYIVKPCFRVKTEFDTKRLLSFFSGKQPLIPTIYSDANALVYSSSAVTSAYTVSLFALA